MLPSHCGSENSSFRVVIDLATERVKRKQAEPADLRPPRIVELLAQAEEFQRLLDSGEAASRADLARRFTMSRARVTQIMNLLKLAPEIRDYLGALPAQVAGGSVTEKRLRSLARLPPEEQRDRAEWVFLRLRQSSHRSA